MNYHAVDILYQMHLIIEYSMTSSWRSLKRFILPQKLPKK